MSRLFLCLLFLFLFSISTLIFTPSFKSDHSSQKIIKKSPNPMSESESESCFPKLDPWHRSFANFIDFKDKISCWKNFAPSLVDLNFSGHLVVDTNSAAMISYLSESPVFCSYVNFESSPDDPDRIVFRSKPKKFYSFSESRSDYRSIQITETDFVKIRCYQNKQPIYTNVFAHGTLKNKRESDYRRFSENGEKVLFSALILIFDGVSLSGFRRRMPSSYDFLINSPMGGRVFPGFTKTSPESSENIVSMFIGNGSDNFLWKKFSDRGYVTSFNENSKRIDLSKIVDRKSIDFYYGPFYSQLKLLRPGYPYCGGDRTILERQLDSLERQLNISKDILQFNVVYFTEMIRDNEANLEYFDSAFFGFLRRMDATNFWKKSFLFLVGARGPTKGPIRRTRTGVFEERMPLLIVKAPRGFLDENPDIDRNLDENRYRLITHFDLYETFRHLLALDRDRNPLVAEIETVPSIGTSLFKKIDIGRNCEKAGIPDQFCPCQNTTTAFPMHSDVRRAARSLLNHVNGILEHNRIYNGSAVVPMHDMCRKFELVRIIRSEWFRFSDPIADSSMTPRLRILIQCTPGDALFEAEMIRWSSRKWFVVSDVSRLDSARAVQSLCVPEEKLKQFCVCLRPPGSK